MRTVLGPTYQEDQQALASKLQDIVYDVRTGTLVQCLARRSKARPDCLKGRAVLRGRSGRKMRIAFHVCRGHLTVDVASFQLNGKPFSWRSADDHGRCEDISDVFGRNLAAAAGGKGLRRVAELPPWRQLLHLWGKAAA